MPLRRTTLQLRHISLTDAWSGIDIEALPSGTGCVECLAAKQWWVHLRRCAQCGHIGCCDTSPNRHARAHFHHTGHPVIRSFEPGESWFWNFKTRAEFEGPNLPPPNSRPLSQPSPGPEGMVPHDWMKHIHA